MLFGRRIFDVSTKWCWKLAVKKDLNDIFKTVFMMNGLLYEIPEDIWGCDESLADIFRLLTIYFKQAITLDLYIALS